MLSGESGERRAPEGVVGWVMSISWSSRWPPGARCLS